MCFMIPPDESPADDSSEVASRPPPRAFLSYSHDDDQHKAWVLKLATRLVHNGVDVILDQWDLTLGSDLTLFMEQGLGTADRVLAVCSRNYVAKANDAQGGVGYERRLITADLMKDLTSDRVIPILRNNPDGTLPRFMGPATYINFQESDNFEDKYAELIHELYDRKIQPRPPLGQSPFAFSEPVDVPAALREDPARYVSPAFSGSVTFDHSNNDGRYVLGSGDMTFTLSVTEAGHGLVHLLNDPHDIQAVALCPGIADPTLISDGTMYDGSSRHRLVRVGDTALLRNRNGYWATVSVDDVRTRDTSSGGSPTMSFRYLIQQNGTAQFSDLRAIESAPPADASEESPPTAF
jgi:hypothetical protein